MSTVVLENVKKIYPVDPDEKKKAKGLFRDKKEETEKEKKTANLQVTDDGVVALQQFDLEVADREFIVLVGPSGCGKSTTLRLIAGLEEISEGNIYIDGVLVNEVSPKDRDVAMVFQNYALYPHMTVYDNMAFALQMKKYPKNEIDRKVREAAGILEITDLLDRKPKALSGGQRQRVAIGRAIVRSPKVLLMDEPLSNLDAKLRNQMRAEIIKLRDKIDTTFIYVTHDQIEAMTLGDRIVVMKDGYIQQIGRPQDVYDHPANIFVAGFIGTPQMNFIDGSIDEENGSFVLNIGSKKLLLNEKEGAELGMISLLPKKVSVGIRPCDVALGDDGIPATIDFYELMGNELQIHASVFGTDIVILAQTNSGVGEIIEKKTKEIFVNFDMKRIHIFDPVNGKCLY